MSNFTLIARNTALLYIRSFFVLLISLYTSRVVISVLGIEDFGIFNVVGGVISMISFVNTSLLASYQRYYNVVMAEENINSLRIWFRSSLSSQLLLAIIIVVISETLGVWFLNTQLVIPDNRIEAANWIYQASVVTIVFTIFEVPYSAMVTAYEKMNVFAIISVLDAVLKLAIVFLLKVVSSDKLIVYSLLLMVISFLDLFLFYIYVEKKFDLGRFSLSWRWEKIKALTSFAGYTFIDLLSQTLKSSGINILLNIFFGPVVNAARGLAFQVLGATNQFVKSFQMSFQPQLIRSYADKDYVYLNNLFFASSKFSYYLILLITVPIIVETSQILHLWLGDNVPEHTVSFVRLILFTSWVSCFANPTSVIIYATGKMRKFTAYVSGLNLAIVPVAYLFLKLGCEPESTMIVSLAITILAQAVRFYILRGMVDIPVVKYLKGVLFPSLLVTLLSFTVPLFLHNISITNTIFFITICFISCLWTAIIIFLCGVNKQERKLITEKIWSVIKK